MSAPYAVGGPETGTTLESEIGRKKKMSPTNSVRDNEAIAYKDKL